MPLKRERREQFSLKTVASRSKCLISFIVLLFLEILANEFAKFYILCKYFSNGTVLELISNENNSFGTSFLSINERVLCDNWTTTLLLCIL